MSACSTPNPGEPGVEGDAAHVKHSAHEIGMNTAVSRFLFAACFFNL